MPYILVNHNGTLVFIIYKAFGYFSPTEAWNTNRSCVMHLLTAGLQQKGKKRKKNIKRSFQQKSPRNAENYFHFLKRCFLLVSVSYDSHAETPSVPRSHQGHAVCTQGKAHSLCHFVIPDFWHEARRTYSVLYLQTLDISGFLNIRSPVSSPGWGSWLFPTPVLPLTHPLDTWKEGNIWACFSTSPSHCSTG